MEQGAGGVQDGPPAVRAGSPAAPHRRHRARVGPAGTGAGARGGAGGPSPPGGRADRDGHRRLGGPAGHGADRGGRPEPAGPRAGGEGDLAVGRAPAVRLRGGAGGRRTGRRGPALVRQRRGTGRDR
ncbi:hypothetical protein [Ornithinimicrobium kibberense]|uniref:hypothetical protein n=1 Tax=Ornithinimicrobium kibberense TaxID=282060 RepID=UPI00361810C9